jgi:dihydrofolate reductase
LDGYIAGPKGEADWIIMDPDIDFSALFAQFDTALIGRRTFEGMARGKKKPGAMPGMKTLVFSRTLRQRDYPEVTIVAEDAGETLTALRAESGKDIWLFGGGLLFRSLLGDLGADLGVDLAVADTPARYIVDVPGRHAGQVHLDQRRRSRAGGSAR